jgi:hypothetical protein
MPLLRLILFRNLGVAPQTLQSDKSSLAAVYLINLLEEKSLPAFLSALQQFVFLQLASAEEAD